jgi:hypothetical protein
VQLPSSEPTTQQAELNNVVALGNIKQQQRQEALHNIMGGRASIIKWFYAKAKNNS